MLSKVVKGGLLVVLVGGLLVGGILLLSRSRSAYAWQGRNRDERSAAPGGGGGGEQVLGGQGRGRGGQGVAGYRRTAQVVQEGQGSGASIREETAVLGGGYGRGNGQATDPGARNKESQVQAAEWQTIEGVAVETTELVIETSDGQAVQVGLGPSHYRDGQGFSLEVGDSVRVSGYYEDGEFKAGQVENLDTGKSIVLRDAYGRPMWAGQGSRKNTVS